MITIKKCADETSEIYKSAATTNRIVVLFYSAFINSVTIKKKIIKTFMLLPA